MSQAGRFVPGTGAAPIETITGDIGGPVAPDGGGNVNLLGGNNITTTGNPGTNTITFDLTGTTTNAVQIGNVTGSLTSIGVGTDGQVLIGATGGAPAFATITSPGGTIVFTPGANSLAMDTAAAVATLYHTDAGDAVPALGILNVLGGSNINTTGVGNTVTINLDDTVSITGSFTAGTFIEATAGNVQILAGNLNIGTATPGNPYDIAIERTIAGLIGESIQNLSNNAAAGVNLQLIVEPATADSFVLYNVNGVTTWSAGIDNSDSDRFKVTTGSSPSAGTEALSIATTGHVTMANDATISTLTLTNPLTVANGGTGAATFTAYSVICAGTAATNPFQNVVGVGNVGEVLTSNGPTLLPTWQPNAAFFFSWNEETGVAAGMAVNNGYIANNAGVVTLTLPAIAVVGNVIRVTGKGAGGWSIAQNAGQTIYFGATNTTTGVGGSLSSTNQRDSVELVCVTANNDWNVISVVGNLTVV